MTDQKEENVLNIDHTNIFHSIILVTYHSVAYNVPMRIIISICYNYRMLCKSGKKFELEFEINYFCKIPICKYNALNMVI